MSLDETAVAQAIETAMAKLLPVKPNEDPKGREILARSVSHAVVGKLKEAFDGGAVTVVDEAGKTLTVHMSTTVETWP